MITERVLHLFPHVVCHLLNLCISSSIMSVISTAELVSHCTLRLLRPACPLDTRWSDEPLNHQTVRSINRLHEITLHHRLASPTLAYVLPLLQRALECGGQAVDSDDTVMIRILSVFEAHAKCRNKDPMNTKLDQVSCQQRRC